MELVILVIHIILAASIIGVILLQPPEGSSLGGLGAANPMAGAAGRGQGNLLTRVTAILATLFIVTSLVLAIMAGHKPKQASILDKAAVTDSVKEASEPVVEKEENSPVPSVPVSQ